MAWESNPQPAPSQVRPTQAAPCLAASQRTPTPSVNGRAARSRARGPATKSNRSSRSRSIRTRGCPSTARLRSLPREPAWRGGRPLGRGRLAPWVRHGGLAEAVFSVEEVQGQLPLGAVTRLGDVDPDGGGAVARGA